MMALKRKCEKSDGVVRKKLVRTVLDLGNRALPKTNQVSFVEQSHSHA